MAGFRTFLPLFVMFLFCHSMAYADELIIRDNKNTVLFSREIPDGGGFAIRYTHSVALTPVTDYFQVKNNKIWLDKTVYKDFGAGLPTAPEAGQTMKVANGEIEIGGFNRDLGEFSLRVGRVAGHTLLLWHKGDRPIEIPLDSLAPPGTALTFSIAGK